MTGFKQIALQDQVKLVREAVYPITLLFHSQFYDPNATKQRSLLAVWHEYVRHHKGGLYKCTVVVPCFVRALQFGSGLIRVRWPS